MQSPILSGTNFQVGGITDLEGQLVRAAEVQRSLSPRRHRRFSGWEVGYTYEPAEFVSGDYVDLIPARDGGFYFVLGDVSGKGIPASILMSHLHATLRAFLRMDLPSSEVRLQGRAILLRDHLASSVCDPRRRSRSRVRWHAGHL